MIVKYFAVYDKKAQGFGNVFPSHTLGSAERSLRESVTNKDSPHSKYPDDYNLFHMFDFDDESGLIVETFEPPQLVCEASALVSRAD